MRPTRIQLSGVILAVFACLILSYSRASALTSPIPQSPWLTSTNPSLEKVSEINPNNPLPISIISNSDCQDREVITRPQRFVAPFQAKVSSQRCVVDTGYGAISNDGHLQRAGSTISGELRTNSGGTAIMLPIPRSSTGLRLGGGPGYGSYLFFYDDLEPNLTSVAALNGEVTHKLPAIYSTMLKNGNDELIAADTTAMSFSADGDWAVFDTPFMAMVRLNTKTREMLPFGDASNPSSGLGAAFRTAISPDGRYAFVASRTHEILRLYDLSTCATPPRVITTKVACNSRDLLPFMRQQIPGFTSVASVRFRSKYTLDIYANSVVGTTTKLTRYAATAAGQETTGFQYLALGDSFASGEGAYNYKAATDTKDNLCHLSQRSYPYLISSTLGYGLSESVACSGAVIEDVVRTDKDYTGQVRDGRTNDERDMDLILTSLLPGYIGQISFIRQNSPNVITLSAGGNDIGFGEKILRCLDTDTCYDSYEDRLEIIQEVNAQFPRLADMYAQIKASNDPRAKIYIIGYPQIAKVDGACDMNVHLNRDERLFAEQLVSYLNGVIKKAAENAGVYYVDVENAFTGHRMCEPINSWDVAVNGLTAGNDKINLAFIHGPIGNESYHPNALGHSLFKVKILEKTNNFTALMPEPNPNAQVSDPDPQATLLQSPKSNRAIKNIKKYTGADGGLMTAGKYWSMRATNLDIVFGTSSKIDAWLNSTPVDLGSYILGADGTINIGANIPGGVTPGFHTLHLYGKNSSGEDVDVYKTVYVESGSACLVPISGQDKDKDGTDDACDGFIDKPPLVVTVATKITQSITSQTQPQSTQSTLAATTSVEPSTAQQITTPQTTQTATLASANQNQTRTPQQASSEEINQPTVLGTNKTPAKTEPAPQAVARVPPTSPAPLFWVVITIFFLAAAIMLTLLFT